MNIKFYILYVFVSFFPLWIFRANLSILDNLILLLLFLFLPILIHIQLFKLFFKSKSKIISFWLSLITFNSLDQNLGLWSPTKNGFLFINFNSPYVNTLSISILSIIILNLLFFYKKIDALKIIFSFILVIFIFNVFDTPKYYSNFPKVNLIENK